MVVVSKSVAFGYHYWASRSVTSVFTITGCHLQNFSGRCVRSGWLSFMFSGAFAELSRESIKLFHVCLSVMEQLGSRCVDYHEI